MTAAQVKGAVRDIAVNKLMTLDTDNTMRVAREKPYTFLMPVVIDGVTYYAQIGVTCKSVTTGKEFIPDQTEWLPMRAGVEAYRAIAREENPT